MEIDAQSATYEKKIEFLFAVLEAAEKRRDSVENKSAILIAANAILLTGIIGLGIPLFTASGDVGLWLKIGLTAGALGAIILSTLWSAQILTPLATQKQRSQIMDLGPNPEAERNLYLFVRIAKFKKAEYKQAIDSLTQQEIFEQLTSEVHNLSLILSYRYQAMRLSHIAFILAIVAFAALAVAKLLLG
jgi:hypothetical protein